MVYGSLSGLAVWNEVSVALYCADIALLIRSPDALRSACTLYFYHDSAR